MKRSIAAVACLLGLVVAASVCSADQVQYHWGTFPLKFRTQALQATINDARSKLTPTVSSGSVTYGTAAYMDSNSFQHVGQGNAVAETTIWFPTSLVSMFRATSPSDSGNIILDLYDTGGNCASCSGTGTIDSLYCTPQFSDDGTNALSSAEILLSMANGATTNAKSFHRKFSTNCTLPAGTLTHTTALGCYKYVRWIIYDDGTAGGTTIHNFFADVRYPSANKEDNR